MEHEYNIQPILAKLVSLEASAWSQITGDRTMNNVNKEMGLRPYFNNDDDDVVAVY